jgi:hypothetical protein
MANQSLLELDFCLVGNVSAVTTSVDFHLIVLVARELMHKRR